jgi:hypothetical protein
LIGPINIRLRFVSDVNLCFIRNVCHENTLKIQLFIYLFLKNCTYDSSGKCLSPRLPVYFHSSSAIPRLFCCFFLGFFLGYPSYFMLLLPSFLPRLTIVFSAASSLVSSSSSFSSSSFSTSVQCSGISNRIFFLVFVSQTI